MSSVYIAAAKRTAFGAFGGTLKNYTAAELGGIAGKAALEELPEDIQVDSVIFGNTLQTDVSGAYLARHAGHLSGVPTHVPALTVNRLCGSGFQAIVNAAQEIKLGESSVVLTGGAENMSHAPYVLSGEARWGTRYGVDLKLVDSLAAALVDRVPAVCSMGQTAENVAAKYGITREETDAYALQSQQRWAEAQAAGAFKDEITPIKIINKKTKMEVAFEIDECPRPKTSLESLAKLKPVFTRDGIVTAATSSGITDGAAANVVVGEAALKKYNIKPLAKVLSYHIVGVEPHLMGLGPIGAIRGALEKASLKIEDIDLFDINEAFAAQWLGCQRELGLPMEKSNVFGGAIALGHPLGASGARISANLVHNLRRLNKRYGVGSACIGGGQGIAVVFEAL